MNLIPNKQNPIVLNAPDVNNNPVVDVRFSFDNMSNGVAFNQFIAVEFPPNVSSDLQFDQGNTNKYSCSLTDGTTTYTMVAVKPLVSSEGNIAYCQLTDTTNNIVKVGNFKLSITLIGTKITSNYVRSMKMFTATSNKTTKMIMDQASFLGNVALYNDPLVYVNKAIDITSSSILLGSSVVTNIYPYQTFDISLNIKSNIFISQNDLLITFKYDKTVVSAAQSVISNSLNLGSTVDPLSAAIKGTLSLSTNTDGDIIMLNGVTEDLIPNRQFQLILKSWKALDQNTNTFSPLEMRVYYKNTHSLISYVKASTNFFKISHSVITLTAEHPDGWDIFRSGIFPMKYTFTSAEELPNGGYVLIQQNNTQDLVNRWNFVAATCDFSENDNNFEQGFGKRPTCNSIRTDFAYTGTPSQYKGSGIFFKLKNIQANKNYFVTVFGSADACGGTTSLTDFDSATPSSTKGTNAKFDFQATIYKTIDATKTNEARFTGSTILGQSISKSMTNTCWNAMTSLMTALDNTPAKNAPANAPFQKELFKDVVKNNQGANAAVCSTTLCALKVDVNLYREFYNIRLVNSTLAYSSTHYLRNITGSPTENFIYGSTNSISSNSFLGLIVDINILGKTYFYESFPSPLAADKKTTGTLNYFRVLPGRVEMKVQKKWFTQGNAASSTTPGCYLAFGVNNALGNKANIVMRDTVDGADVDVDCPKPAAAVGKYSLITSYTKNINSGTDCTTAIPTMDTTGSNLPVSNNSNTHKSYKILSTWSNSGAGAASSGASYAAVLGSGLAGDKTALAYPLPAAAMEGANTINATIVTFGIFSTCLKWNPSISIKSLYTSIDIQLNHLYATTSSTTSYIPHRAVRLIKLFPEGGVFQDVGTSKILAAGSNDQTTDNLDRAYKLHQSFGVDNTKTGVCLIEINSKGLEKTSDSSSPVLAIWIGFGTILESDYTDLSATYPVAPLANSSYNTYGLQSGIFFNTNENFNVHKNFANTTKYSDGTAANINQNNLRLHLMINALTGQKADIENTGGAITKYNSETTAYNLDDIVSNNRSSYLFLMGSVVFVTGISSNSITTNTNADNLLIPIYCPINDTSKTTTIQMSGLPTLYMAFLKMSAFNDISSVNKIYNMKYTTGVAKYLTIITSEANGVAGAQYYKQNFGNNSLPNLFNSTTLFYNYLWTLRWTPYTSTINNNDNILYFYYSNKASFTAATGGNNNCTGHTLLINSNVVSINADITKIKRYGFSSVQEPAVYQGSKKFYYLGNEFNKAIMMGLGLANNPGDAIASQTTGLFTAQVLTSEASTYYLEGINRPSVDKFYENNVFNAQFQALAYFCNSAQQASYEAYANYFIYPSSLTKSFIIDFNPPVTSPKTWTVAVTQDKSETIYKNDVAGNTKMNIKLPAKIPGGVNLKFYAKNNAFDSNTICGIVSSSTKPLTECTQASSLFSCPTDRNDIDFVICCYNVSVSSDTFAMNEMYVDFPKAPNADQAVRFNTDKVYDAATQIASTGITWTTGQSSGIDVIGTQSAKISKVEYYQVVQDSGIGKVVFLVNLPREPVRNMALTFVGDFSAMLIPNNLPRCSATFGTKLGSSWDSTADILLESCDVTNFSGSAAPIVITTKNIVYKCGLAFTSKELKVSLWPIVEVNWKNNPYSSNNYKVTMTLNTSSNSPIANSSTTFNVSNNLSYSAKPGFTGQWDTLCTVSSVVPKIPGEYADYTFDLDLDTNKSALTNGQANEVSIFFPFQHYGASIDNIVCFYNNATMNCSFTDEGILNIRFTTELPVGSGKKIPIIIAGIYNPSYTGEIYFPCTINNTNFSTGLRKNLITGSGKLSGGIPIANNVSQGNLRFINVLNATDLNPRNTSTHTFRITFDQAIGLTSTPITITNTPQVIITFPDDYNLSWYTTTKATASIDEYTSDTTNKITKTSTISPASVTQSGNRVTITLKPASYTFSTSWRYWEIKVNQITGPTEATTATNNGTTGAYSILMTNSIYSAIYRTHSNLNNSAYNTMVAEADSFLKYNRGIEFKYDQTKWVVDINTSGVYNILTVRPGRFTLSTFSIKSNSANFIQPRSATISLSNQIFKLADTKYEVVTAKNQATNFYIGAPCGTAPGKYIVNFSMSGNEVTTYFAPLAPVQITLDSLVTGTVDYTIPASIPAGASTLIYYTLSEPNFDKLTITWKTSETVKTDSTAEISKAVMEVPTIKAGELYVKSQDLFSTFKITNLQATNNQVFSPNDLNNCYKWTNNVLTITISGTQAIIPNQYNFTSSFKYFNSANDSTVTSKNSIKFEFTPPYSPIYVYCSLVCYNRNFPSDDVIRKFDNVSDNLTSYYSSMFSTKTKTNIIFKNLVRGQRYKLRCIISSTEGVESQRTSAAVSIEELASNNGTVTQFIPTAVTKTQCVQYYFTSDPGQATKIAMINYCQKLFTGTGYTSSGCIVCTDSDLTYTSPGISLPTNLTCTASATKSRLRFLQTTPEDTTNNSTILTPTSASSNVNPSLVNQSNPITFSVCPVQHPVCTSDVSGNKLYSDYFDQLIADTKTTALFNKNLGIVNVPVNNTLIVTDLVAPDISKNFVSEVTSINSNGLIVFNAKFTSALRCSWQIADSSAAPATGSAITSCTDSQWCGRDFQVGTLVSNAATDINNLKAFSSGKSYALYFACLNDVPYSTSVSNIFSTPLSVPNTTPTTPTTPTSPTEPTDGTSAGFNVFSYAILLILALLI
jgi:hypothetical protein